MRVNDVDEAAVGGDQGGQGRAAVSGWCGAAPAEGQVAGVHGDGDVALSFAQKPGRMWAGLVGEGVGSGAICG